MITRTELTYELEQGDYLLVVPYTCGTVGLLIHKEEGPDRWTMRLEFHPEHLAQVKELYETLLARQPTKEDTHGCP